jgi:hypothetical protein
MVVAVVLLAEMNRSDVSWDGFFIVAVVFAGDQAAGKGVCSSCFGAAYRAFV